MWLRKCAVICLLLAALCAHASAACLTWEAPDVEAGYGVPTGYRVHYGTASGTYTNTVDAGLDLEWPLPDAWPAGTYYFATTAYNAAGDSACSNEAVWIKQNPPPADPPARATNVQVAFRQVTQTMAAPTFINSYQTAWNSSATPKTTASFNVVAGDVLVAFGAVENGDSGYAVANPPTGSLSITWTMVEDFSNNYIYCGLRVWTGTVGSNQNGVNVQFAGGGGVYWGGCVFHFRGSSGIGAVTSLQDNPAGVGPSLNILTTQANSAVVVIDADWAAVTGSTAWITNAGSCTDIVQYADGAHYAVRAGYHPDAGAVNTCAVGMTAPTDQTFTIVAVEVKGSAGGSIDLSGSAAGASATPAAAMTAARPLAASSAGLSTTPAAPMVVSRALSSTAQAASACPAAALTVSRPLAAAASGVSATPAAAITAARPLTANSAGLSATPNAALTTARLFAAAAEGTSATAPAAMTVANRIELAASAAAGSATAPAAMTAARAMMATAAGASATSISAADVTGQVNLAAAAAAVSAAPAAALTAGRPLAVAAAGQSATAPAAMTVASRIELAAAAAAGSATQPAVMTVDRGIASQAAASSAAPPAAMTIDRGMAAAAAASSATPAATLTVARGMAASAAGASATPPATLNLGLMFSASAAAAAATAPAAMTADRLLAALSQAHTDAPAAEMIVQRLLIAAAAGISETAPAAIAFRALGLIIDPAIESLTPPRGMESLSIPRRCVSLTPARMIRAT